MYVSPAGLGDDDGAVPSGPAEGRLHDDSEEDPTGAGEFGEELLP